MCKKIVMATILIFTLNTTMVKGEEWPGQGDPDGYMRMTVVIGFLKTLYAAALCPINPNTKVCKKIKVQIDRIKRDMRTIENR